MTNQIMPSIHPLGFAVPKNRFKRFVGGRSNGEEEIGKAERREATTSVACGRRPSVLRLRLFCVGDRYS